MMIHPSSYPPQGTLPSHWPSWTDWPASSPPPPSLFRTGLPPIATGGTDPLLLTRDYHPLDFHGFDAETDPRNPSIGSVAVPPGWEEKGEEHERRASLQEPSPVPSARMRRREQRHHFFWRVVRTLLMTMVSLLCGIILSTLFFVIHVLPLLPDWEASSPLGTWTPIRHVAATVVPRSTSLALTPAPQRHPDLIRQTGGFRPPALVGEDACLVGFSQVQDTTGKGELDLQVVQQALSSSHLQMFIRVETQAQTSVAILSETQFGQVEQSLYGSQDLGTPPPGGIESPTAHEFCSLYLITDTTHDWVAIGGKAGVAPFTTGEYQAAMTLYHQVEQATGGRHTGAVLAVLAYFHSLLVASSISSSPTPMTP